MTAIREQEYQIDGRLQHICFDIMARAAVSNGVINPTGMSDLQFVKAVRDWVQTLPRDAIGLVIDHREPLLEHARRFQRSEQNELACLFYATWTEHFINATIRTMCVRKRITHDEITSIIRDVPLRGKATWLLRVLGAPLIPRQHVVRIDRLATARNAFVHYKWKITSDDVTGQLDRELQSLVVDYEKTVRYLQRYESKKLLHGIKHRIRKLSKT